MAVKWTDEQKDAILEIGSNILVAAAAGSGKTAVLVERIIQKIVTKQIDIDKLLVVTFTNSAAAEMRERILDAIYKKLEEEPENENLQRQITLLAKASICTIDSFCLEVLRNNFYELEGISPNFRIAEVTETELLKQEVLEDLFEEKYEKQDGDFLKLVTTYTSYKDDMPLKDLILKIDNYMQSMPFPEKWLKEKVKMLDRTGKEHEDFAKTVWGEALLQELEEELIDGITILEEIQKDLAIEPELEDFEKIISNDIEKLLNLKNNLDSWDRSFEISQERIFVDWSRKKVQSSKKDEAKQIRDEVKKRVTKKIEKILIENSEAANEDMQEMYDILVKLQNVILEFEEEFSKRKREQNIVDFSDIEHFALKLLVNEDEEGKVVPTDVAKKYQEKFEEIAIDEYQDSNLVQEYILTSVSKGNNLFMVGDVKQSIYKFRQAMPELFLNKYETYVSKKDKKDKDNLKIQLFKNFRSRDNVLNFTNLVFENIMSSLLGDIEYNEEEYLNVGASYEDIEQNLDTEIMLIDLKEQEAQNVENIEEQEEIEKIEDIEIEAKLVAKRIKELIDEKFQVYDKKIEGFRDITYKDIVILLRSPKNKAPIYEQELAKLDVPVFSDSSQEYLESIEIETILSLLKIIDNPMQDIPLVTVLRSNIGDFTDNDLVEIRLSDKTASFYECLQKARLNVNDKLRDKIQDFLDDLDKWRKEQEYLQLDELIWKIYTDTGYYNYVGLMPNGEVRQANLKMLFERAKQYETVSFKGLYNFLRYIERLKIGNGDLSSAKIIGENDNVVRIMSIHKSKGLEFPVVFLADLGKQFNFMDLNESILLHQEMGVGVKYIDYEKQIQYDTLSKLAIRNKMLKEILSEEMRILYVALTRAKEKLILTGRVRDYEKQIEKMTKQVNMYSKTQNKINPILVKKYKTFMDWILLVYLYEIDKELKQISLSVVSKEGLINGLESKEKEKIDINSILQNYKIDEKDYQKVEDLLKYEYENVLATKIPTKTSVTKIKEMKQQEKQGETIIQDNEKTTQEEPKLLDFPTPNFLKNKEEERTLTGAQKGTIIHKCMQRLNEKIDYDYDKVEELVQELVLKGIITQNEAKQIDINKILQFTKSKIWEDLKNAKEVYREKPFYINIPANEIYNKDIEEKVLVQGIIDLYYIDAQDQITLVDYKTDYVQKGQESELIQKYEDQLEIYKKALEEALGKKVKNVYIYSTYLGQMLKF